jgi:Thioredoxin like C-terminal domain
MTGLATRIIAAGGCAGSTAAALCPATVPAYASDQRRNSPWVKDRGNGESEYQQSEMVIQQLLAEAGSAGVGHELVSVDARGAEAPADWAILRSPENYTGYERTENFASPGGAVLGKRHVYTAPAELRLNHWALSGDWTTEEQAATLNEADGQIVCRFHARDLHLVMGPAVPGTSVRFRALIDGQPPGAAHGADDLPGTGRQLSSYPGGLADRAPPGGR